MPSTGVTTVASVTPRLEAGSHLASEVSIAHSPLKVNTNSPFPTNHNHFPQKAQKY